MAGDVLFEGRGFRVVYGPWCGNLVVYKDVSTGWEYLGHVHVLDVARGMDRAEEERALLDASNNGKTTWRGQLSLAAK